MTSSHIFYIPLILIIGLILGIALGRRSALVTMQEEERRRARAAARSRDRRADAAPSPSETDVASRDPDAQTEPDTHPP